MKKHSFVVKYFCKSALFGTVFNTLLILYLYYIYLHLIYLKLTVTYC